MWRHFKFVSFPICWSCISAGLRIIVSFVLVNICDTGLTKRLDTALNSLNIQNRLNPWIKEIRMLILSRPQTKTHLKWLKKSLRFCRKDHHPLLFPKFTRSFWVLPCIMEFCKFPWCLNTNPDPKNCLIDCHVMRTRWSCINIKWRIDRLKQKHVRSRNSGVSMILRILSFD